MISRIDRNELILTPAAISHHHSHPGGYLMHVREVYQYSFAIAKVSDKQGFEINESLLWYGTLLHDLGKLTEYQGLPARYSLEAQTIGHIPLTLMRLQTAFQDLGVDFCKRYKFEMLEICHMISSHHGKKEWGSTTTPTTPEAVILHFADMISSRMGVLMPLLKKKEADLGGRKEAIIALFDSREFKMY